MKVQEGIRPRDKFTLKNDEKVFDTGTNRLAPVTES